MHKWIQSLFIKDPIPSVSPSPSPSPSISPSISPSLSPSPSTVQPYIRQNSIQSLLQIGSTCSAHSAARFITKLIDYIIPELFQITSADACFQDSSVDEHELITILATDALLCEEDSGSYNNIIIYAYLMEYLKARGFCESTDDEDQYKQIKECIKYIIKKRRNIPTYINQKITDKVNTLFSEFAKKCRHKKINLKTITSNEFLPEPIYDTLDKGLYVLFTFTGTEPFWLEFEDYDGTHFHDVPRGDCDPGDTHVLNIVGYKQSGNKHPTVVMKNSWGTQWGNNGYMIINRNIFSSCNYPLEYNYFTIERKTKTRKKSP